MASASSAEQQWMVLLEAADDDAAPGIEPSEFRHMVSAWAAAPPAALHSPCRYALQVSVSAADAQSALAAVLGLWSDALRRSGLPQWPLVRAEIVTAAEFESEYLVADTGRRSSPADADSDDLLRRALHDGATGLPARELFLDQVREALARTAAPAVRAVMVVDVDGLDPSAPDDVILEVAGRLKDAVRRGDLVGRVGPARFALLVTVPTGADIDRVARRVVTNVRSPMLDAGPALSVTASVGVARTSPGADTDDLIRMAEVATAAAKAAGGDCHRDYAARSDSV